MSYVSHINCNVSIFLCMHHRSIEESTTQQIAHVVGDHSRNNRNAIYLRNIFRTVKNFSIKNETTKPS